jgi:hypothetical protein
MKTSTAVAAFAFLLIGAQTVAGFGTIHGLGQDAEHERITRRAFACAASKPSNDCFEKRTLDSLAGKPGSFGAIGIADRGALVFRADAHCDGGDYFKVKGYPQSKAEARAKLEACRAQMAEQLDKAVEAAGDLLDADGHLDDSQMPTIVSCNYGGRVKGRAKCNVLEAFGLLLHASQDFYSHTNWTDVADADAPHSPKNPPGLGKTGPAPWLDLRTAQPFPDGLISGCFEAKSAISEPANCNYGPNKTPRVKHLALSKDKGRIDPQIGAGTTERGRVNANFRRAVEAAVADSKDKWATLQEQLILTYGPSRGTRMICALTRDDPKKSC